MKIVSNVPGMQVGEDGVVVGVDGGLGVTGRLDAMGIRSGVRLTKVSGRATRGPQTVRARNAQVAMGFGVAAKVRVEIVRGPSS